MDSIEPIKPIIVALDFSSPDEALRFTDKLDPNLCRLKVGFELFVSAGPSLIRSLVSRNFDVFLDLKFYDIPNTVAAACAAASKLGIWMLNVHAIGGVTMMRAARNAVRGLANPPKLIAVTVLTSLDTADLKESGINRTAIDQTVKLAELAQSADLDGVVCSPQEASALRQQYGKEFLLVTPGIRLQGSDSNDQKRILSPLQAIQAGANFLVVGRPIIQATDPLSVVHALNDQIGAKLD